MSNLFSLLSALESQSHTTAQLSGRNLSLTLGQIVNVDDPEGYNRIQVLLSSEGGKSISPWYYRTIPISRLAIPVDLVARTAVCGYIDGDPHEGLVLGLLVNDLTRMDTKGDELLYQLGASVLSVKDKTIMLSTGNVTLTLTDDDITVNGKSLLSIGSKDTRGDTNIEKGWSVAT